jgi:hypothetical protein
MVFFALVTACRLAGAPTRISPSSMYATIEGVVRAPFGILDHLRLAAFHDGDAGVRGAEVDADDLAHVGVLRSANLSASSDGVLSAGSTALGFLAVADGDEAGRRMRSLMR